MNRIDHRIAKALPHKSPTSIRYHGNRLILELCKGERLDPDFADQIENVLRNTKPLNGTIFDQDEPEPEPEPKKTKEPEPENEPLYYSNMKPLKPDLRLKGVEPFVFVYCQECGARIANLSRLLTPTEFKDRFGDTCPKCGHKFNRTFDFADKQKRIDQYGEK